MFFLGMSKLKNDLEIKVFCLIFIERHGWEKIHAPFQSETFSCRKKHSNLFLHFISLQITRPGLVFQRMLQVFIRCTWQLSIFRLKLKSCTTQIKNGKNTSSAVSFPAESSSVRLSWINSIIWVTKLNKRNLWLDFTSCSSICS